jgi:hypothetical protein
MESIDRIGSDPAAAASDRSRRGRESDERASVQENHAVEKTDAACMGGWPWKSQQGSECAIMNELLLSSPSSNF